ncbi:maleylpyruvate isomerase N-terminal domain-containing protein [Pengzhenrongella phosphoraccumulans]|uniref:maleylpyruvate isomerase N-terminal domain-containing protein n=1 Tax=Pengzhenrongella phosphoraccumulans TaxID=3114394 RepID=UPI003890E818
MSDDWAVSRQLFRDAADWFVATTAQVGDRWSEPGLGDWDVRALVGHTSRSLLTVQTYLGIPAPAVDLDSTTAYYLATSSIAAGPEVAQRGRDAGEALGVDPAAAVAAIARRVLPLLDNTDGTELVTTVAGGMRLSAYLPTRTFELVVHTLDLGATLGLVADPPPGAASQSLRIVADLAVARGLAAPLLLAATGRTLLPAGFSIL